MSTCWGFKIQETNQQLSTHSNARVPTRECVDKNGQRKVSIAVCPSLHAWCKGQTLAGLFSLRLDVVDVRRNRSDSVDVPPAGSQSGCLTLTQLLSRPVLRQMCNSHLMRQFSSKFSVRCWLSGLASNRVFLFCFFKLSLLCLNKGLYNKNVYIFFGLAHIV